MYRVTTFVFVTPNPIDPGDGWWCRTVSDERKVLLDLTSHKAREDHVTLWVHGSHSDRHDRGDPLVHSRTQDTTRVPHYTLLDGSGREYERHHRQQVLKVPRGPQVLGVRTFLRFPCVHCLPRHPLIHPNDPPSYLPLFLTKKNPGASSVSQKTRNRRLQGPIPPSTGTVLGNSGSRIPTRKRRVSSTFRNLRYWFGGRSASSRFVERVW